MIRRIPEITAKQENFRIEPVYPVSSAAGNKTAYIQTIRRDPVEPVPIGTYIARVFRVTGYDQDCDGSLMARLAAVDKTGEDTGWEPTHLGLYRDSAWIVDNPDELDVLTPVEQSPLHEDGCSCVTET